MRRAIVSGLQNQATCDLRIAKRAPSGQVVRRPSPVSAFPRGRGKCSGSPALRLAHMTTPRPHTPRASNGITNGTHRPRPAEHPKPSRNGFTETPDRRNARKCQPATRSNDVNRNAEQRIQTRNGNRRTRQPTDAIGGNGGPLKALSHANDERGPGQRIKDGTGTGEPENNRTKQREIGDASTA